MGKWDEQAAMKAVDGYIDYFEGRAIKADLNDPRFKRRDATLFTAYDFFACKKSPAKAATAATVLGWN